MAALLPGALTPALGRPLTNRSSRWSLHFSPLPTFLSQSVCGTSHVTGIGKGTGDNPVGTGDLWGEVGDILDLWECLSFLGTHSGRTSSCANERSCRVDHAVWREAGIHRWGQLRKRLGNQACCETGRTCLTWNKTMGPNTLLNYSNLFELGLLVPTAITIRLNQYVRKLPLAATLWGWYYCISVCL